MASQLESITRLVLIKFCAENGIGADVDGAPLVDERTRRGSALRWRVDMPIAGMPVVGAPRVNALRAKSVSRVRKICMVPQCINRTESCSAVDEVTEGRNVGPAEQ